MPKTQLFSKKNDKFYSDRPAPTTAVITRIEENSVVYARVENLYAHCVATSDIVQSELQTIDGYAVRDGDIVLCANQLIPNRRWLARVNGAGAWTPTGDKVHAGISVAIAYGTLNAGSLYVCQLPFKATEQGLEETVWVKQQPASELQYIWSMVRRLVKATYDKIMCYIEEIRPYEVICHADTVPITFSVPSGATTTIPFSNLIYTPSDGHYSLGHFFVNKAGYYDVDVRFLCPPKTAPVTLISLSILGSFGGGTVDEVIIGTEILRLQGSLKIYCEVGDSIYAALYQNSGVTILFSAAADTQAAGYISISFAGKTTAATNV